MQGDLFDARNPYNIHNLVYDYAAADDADDDRDDADGATVILAWQVIPSKQRLIM